MGQYLENHGTGDMLPNGQLKIIVGKIIAIQVVKKTQNIQHIANLAIRLLSCAPNLKHCKIILWFEKFLEFHCIFCTYCKDVHSRYFQTMSFVAIFPSNWAVTCPTLLCRSRMFLRIFFCLIWCLYTSRTNNVFQDTECPWLWSC